MKLFAVIAATLLLAGCAGTEESAPAPSATVTKAQAEATYLEELQEAIPDHARATTAQWLDVGNSICAAYKEGVSPNEVIDSMQGSNLTADEAAAVVVLSAKNLCPEYD